MMIAAITEDKYSEAMALHEKMGADYPLDLERSDFIIKNGMFDGGKLVTVVLGRITTEAYLLLDREWRQPEDRYDALERLIGVSAAEARLYGVVDTHVWVPPTKRCFTRRLKRMGFIAVPWDCMTARI
jgi:hypothetical protein